MLAQLWFFTFTAPLIERSLKKRRKIQGSGVPIPRYDSDIHKITKCSASYIHLTVMSMLTSHMTSFSVCKTYGSL